MAISDLVSVNITRETTVAPLVAFGVPMLFSDQTVTADRINFYSSLSDLSNDFGTEGIIYDSASKIFAQNPPVDQIAVGRRAVDDVEIEVTSAVVGNTYTVTINGTDFDYTAQVSDSATDIASALEVAISGGSEPVSASTTTSTLELSADVSNDIFSLTVSGDLAVQTASATETVAESLDAIIDASDNFYAIISIDLPDADLAAVDSYIVTNNIKKVQSIASSDSDIWTSTGDIFESLSNTGNNRTFGIAHKDASTEYPHAGAMGEILTFDPGTASLAYKTLNDVDPSQFTESERTTIRGKDGSTYETRAGQNIIYAGRMFGGTAFDIVIGTDWLETTIAEDVYELLVNQPKVSYTDAGVLKIEAALRGVLDLAVDRGVLASFSITRKPVADISSTKREAGNYDGLEFTGVFAGSIIKVEIQGSISF